MQRRSLLTAALAAPNVARAQTDPWRIVVNFPPGGLLDGTARLLADRLQRDGHGTAIVENRAGAAGNIGAAAVARARPDGRTVLGSLDTVFTVNPHLYRDQGFDPARDLVPLAMLSSFPLVLLVHPTTGIDTVAAFVAAARKAPMFYVSAGIGSPGHLAMEHLRQRLGLPETALEHVPQRGNTDALTALLSGTVPAGFLAMGGAPSLIRDGKLKPLAVSAPDRDPALPEIPTIAESGVAGFDVRIATMLLIPRAAPEAPRRIWTDSVAALLADPATAPRFAGWGIRAEAADPAAWIETNRARWGAVVRDARMRAE